MFSSLGLSESVEATVSENSGKIKGFIYELRATCGIEAAIDLYESRIVPSLLANCATWLDIEKKTEDKLNNIKDLLRRTLLKAPQFTPRLAIRGCLGLLGMRFSITLVCQGVTYAK